VRPLVNAPTVGVVVSHVVLVLSLRLLSLLLLLSLLSRVRPHSDGRMQMSQTLYDSVDGLGSAAMISMFHAAARWNGAYLS